MCVASVTICFQYHPRLLREKYPFIVMREKYPLIVSTYHYLSFVIAYH